MEKLKLRGRRVLVMGLGLHGGGVESARYAVSEGAQVVCTDLRDGKTLSRSIAALKGLNIDFVLGEHRKSDFDSADIIVKNPAVPADSPWIAGRENIETDISLFLREATSPIIAVTGSKGKSTVVTALRHIIATGYPGVRLGGNITVSPLSFLPQLRPDDPVILELSSWQLADLRGRALLKPKVLCITNLMHDHQNRYASFADYEADKTVIFESMADDAAAFFPDNEYGHRWASTARGECFPVREKAFDDATQQGAWLDTVEQGFFTDAGRHVRIVPKTLRVPGKPFRINMLFAAAMSYKFGIEAGAVCRALEEFSGVPYRMEMFLEKNGIRYYDDTTATIPEATAAAVRAMDRPVVLIAGGTDKKLDFSALADIAAVPKRIILLEGSATDAMHRIFADAGADVEGPFTSMEQAVNAAEQSASAGDAILLSPGATSFGMFTHEFERGDMFKDSCRA